MYNGNQLISPISFFKMHTKKIVTGVSLFFLGAILMSTTLFSIDAGEIGVVTRFGNVISERTSGLNAKLPIDNVHRFSIRETKLNNGTFDDAGDVVTGISAYTRDRQTVMAALTVSYQITDPLNVYNKYRTEQNMIDSLIWPIVRQQLEIVFSRYTAITVIEKREEFAIELRNVLKQAFEPFPITLNEVQAVFNFSEDYEKAIEASANRDGEILNKERETKLALENARRQKAEADGNAQAILIAAEADAKKRKLEADAIAHTIRVKGEAEAASAKALAEALEKNKELVALKTAEKWNGVLPTYIPNGSIMPFITLPNQPNVPSVQIK